MDSLSNILASYLENIADKLRKGTSDVDKDTLLQCFELLQESDSTQLLSKEQACKYLNMSRSTFDTYIRNGWISPGQKRLGFKELSWTKCDLEKAILELNQDINK